jgi:hypothetical protein
VTVSRSDLPNETGYARWSAWRALTWSSWPGLWRRLRQCDVSRDASLPQTNLLILASSGISLGATPKLVEIAARRPLGALSVANRDCGGTLVGAHCSDINRRRRLDRLGWACPSRVIHVLLDVRDDGSGQVG